MSTWKEMKKMNEQPLITSGIQTDEIHDGENFEPSLSTKISKKVVKKDYEKSQKAFDEKLEQKGKVLAYDCGEKQKDLE